jgi:3-oxoacyl-[acyl-carrier-protein] synthase-3
MFTSQITGTGSYTPDVIVRNSDFIENKFFERTGIPVEKSTASVIEKFSEITGIAERRYARPDQNTSDLGVAAAELALADAGVDRETLDYIIVAHNFGDVNPKSNRSNFLPTVASRIKAKLEIWNPNCVAYDLPFGCPGWVEALIQANYFIRSGDASRCLVVGAETLSRILDSHDRDSMIYSDGAGAAVVERVAAGTNGILAHKSQTFAYQHAQLLALGPSFVQDESTQEHLYLKMNGRKVYEFALNYVPPAIKAAIDKAGITLSEVKKILIHQANEKMDQAILQRLYKLCGIASVPADIMPMTIGWLGNSSVATIPTMLDLILRGNLPGHRIESGDVVVFASVGAGMNINAVVYRF